MSSLYINIHSHHSPAPGERCIRSIYRNFSENTTSVPVSMGLHPWHIKAETAAAQFVELQQASIHENVWAMGECGLDKAIVTDIKFQEKIFVQQLLWANEINKPLIIHCVRAFDEILKLLQIHKNKVPVIFHGFNKNRLLAEKLTAKGHWLSFGKALLQAGNHENFLSVTADKYFLETDDAAVSIEIIYKAAANIKNTTVDELHLQLKKNVRTVFNISV